MKLVERDGKKYRIKVISWGYSFVRPQIAVQKKFLGIIPYWKNVCNENPWHVTRASTFLTWSDDLINQWYSDALDQYIDSM